MRVLLITIWIMFIASFVIVEILREIVDRQRVKRDGFGGTQDIAMIGVTIQIILLILGIIFGIGWLNNR